MRVCHIVPPGEVKAAFTESMILQLRVDDKEESSRRYLLGLRKSAQGGWARVHVAFHSLDNKVTNLVC